MNVPSRPKPKQIDNNIYTSVFLISSYGAPLAQQASLALHSSLFGPVEQLVMIIFSLNSISSLLIGSRCILNGAHTNHF